MQREFVDHLKREVEKRKKSKEEKLKVIQGFTNKFMMMNGVVSDERDSISVHYSDNDSISSLNFNSPTSTEAN